MKVSRFAILMTAALALAAMPAMAQLGHVGGAVGSTLGGQATAQHGNNGLGVGLGSQTQGTLGVDAGDAVNDMGQKVDNTTDRAQDKTRETAQKTHKAAKKTADKTEDAAESTADKSKTAADKTADKAKGTSVDANASSSTHVQAGKSSTEVDSQTSVKAGAGSANANSGADKQKGMDRAETRGKKNAKANQAIDRNEARQDNTSTPRK